MFDIIIRIICGLIVTLFLISLLFFIVSMVILYGKMATINDYEEYFSQHLKSVFVYAISFKNIYWIIANIVIVGFVGIASAIRRFFYYDKGIVGNIAYGGIIISIMYLSMKIIEYCYTNFHSYITLLIAAICSTIIGIWSFIKIDLDFEPPYHGKMGFTVFTVAITSLIARVFEYSIINNGIIIGIITAIIFIIFLFMLITSPVYG